jgi:hypothetical protein
MSWHIEGQYMETCNCTYVCPCLGSNLTATPTEGDCKAAFAFQIAAGEKDGTPLDGLTFIVLLHAPAAMGKGGMTVGLVVDERASAAQTEAIGAIASGAAGGPMAGLAPLVATIAGIEKRPIAFQRDGMKFSVKAGELVDQACEGVAGPARPGEPIYLDNTCHPANPRVALAKARHSKFHAFGIDWDDASSTRNGHFAPFAWAG